jgi:hypothetical protein
VATTKPPNSAPNRTKPQTPNRHPNRTKPSQIEHPNSAPKPDDPQTRLPELDEAKPKMPGAVPTNRHKPIPTDLGPISWCFDHGKNFLTAR